MPAADSKKILETVEWLWSNRGNNMFWRPGVLTVEFNKQDPKAPKVTLLEAESIFRQLLERGLVFTGIARDGHPAYWLHESKIIDWEAFIAEKIAAVNKVESDNLFPPKSGSDGERQGSSNDNPSEQQNKIALLEVFGGVILVGLGCACTEAEFHYFAYVFYFASVLAGLDAACRYWKAATWIRVSAAVAVALCCFCFCRYQYGKSKSESVRSSQSAPNVVLAAPSDFIEGTQYTRKRLTEIFPYGYAVFFYGQNNRTLIDESTNNLMDWQVLARSIVIKPDFSNRRVQFTIPSVDATPGTVPVRIKIEGSTFFVESLLKTGYARRAGFMLPNLPVMHVIVLSDNQRALVFAIGYRMPVGNEGRPETGSPCFLIQP